MTSRPPVISVVTTLYRSESSLSEFHARMARALSAITSSYEMILVNDGSPDASLAQAISLQKLDPRVVVMDLSRNFGQHRALLTGLAQAKGELVFLIESDLDEQPEWIGNFHEVLTKNAGLDVVYGVQARRRGLWFERWSGQAFYSLFNLFSDIRIPKNHITSRLITRRYANALLEFGDRELFLGGIYDAVGFQQAPFQVNKIERAGSTNYSVRRKITLAVDAVTSFSSAPLELIFLAGLLITAVSTLAVAWLAGRWALHGIPPGGWGLAGSFWLMGGILMISLGIVGVYVKKTLGEAKRRPLAVVRQVYRAE